MTAFDGKEFAAEIIRMTKVYVSKKTERLESRIAALEDRFVGLAMAPAAKGNPDYDGLAKAFIDPAKAYIDRVLEPAFVRLKAAEQRIGVLADRPALTEDDIRRLGVEFRDGQSHFVAKVIDPLCEQSDFVTKSAGPLRPRVRVPAGRAVVDE